MRTAVPLGVLAATLSMPAAAGAQPPAGTFDELLTRVKRGETIWVTDRTGRENEARVVDLANRTLALEIGGHRLALTDADVVRVRRVRHDPLWDGAVVGLVATLAYPIWFCSQSYESGETCGENLGELVLSGLVGAAAGAGIDALITKRRIVYEAQVGSSTLQLRPLVSRRTQGLEVSWRFGARGASPGR
jgi:hypothetical protein